jgi:hypothetical protein
MSWRDAWRGRILQDVPGRLRVPGRRPPVTAAIAGLGSGALHALSGPDHLLSLVPLSAGRARGAWRVGLAWGLGHAAGTLLAASLLLVVLSAARLEVVSVWAERAAGGALVAMGIANGVALRRARATAGGVPAAGRAAVFAVGLVHGVTGAAALLLLLPAAGAGGREATLFLGGFTLGSTAAMAALTAAVAWLSRAGRLSGVLARVPVAASAASIAVGLAWAATAG